MNDIELSTISTRDKFGIAQILQKSTFLTNDRTVNIRAAIESSEVVLSPAADRYLRKLDGCELTQIRALGIVILGQLEQAFYGVL